MTMIDHELVGLFAILSSVGIAGAFVYANRKLNAEARAAAAKKANTITQAAECCSPPPHCCESKDTLDA